jgi:uncharacterized protein DUF1566/galactose oxidase-like protein/Kelch motif protein
MRKMMIVMPVVFTVVLCALSAWAAPFTMTGPLGTARAFHTATLLQSGKVLVAGGFSDSSEIAATELYDPASGTWSTGAALKAARYYHTATLLANGKVLITGGTSGAGYLSTAEIYDPAAGTTTVTGNMTTPRYYHTATLLNNGMVLIAGGSSYSTELATAELYDPTAGTFTATGNLTSARTRHVATLLADGTVLITGGASNGAALNSVMVFNPATGTFLSVVRLKVIQTMTASRIMHTATLLPNGKVLIAGGYNGSGSVATAEIFDPAASKFTPFTTTGSMSSARGYHTATLLPNGKVLITGGGNNAGALSGAELYDPAAGTFNAASGMMNAARYYHTATLLSSGNVLLVGGYDGVSVLSSAEIFLTWPAEPARTGQTSCWDAAGTPLTSCAGTGQDGDTLTGIAWPSPRFIDNSVATTANLTVTDKLSGLIWAKNGNLAAGMKTWQQALDYIKTLNSGNYLGYNDWRLPNRNELESLVNKQLSHSAQWLNTQGFTNVQANWYWSSSTYADYTFSAWYVYMYAGRVSYNVKGGNGYVWPVRSGQSGTLTLPKTGQTDCYDASGASRTCSGTGEDGEQQIGTAWPSTRFNDNSIAVAGNLTVTDKLTGLIWAKNGNLAAGAITWQQALDYIKTLNSSSGYLGHNDWRLPNRNELESLVNQQQPNSVQWLNTQGFTNVRADYYWSSSTYANDPYSAWGVLMVDGYVSYNGKAGNGYVWPVRSGQVGTLTSSSFTTTTSISAPSITYGVNGSIIVTVSSASAAPAGNATLSMDGGEVMTQALSAATGTTATATFTITKPTAGSHALSAGYAAQGTFGASSASGTLTVNQQYSLTIIIIGGGSVNNYNIASPPFLPCSSATCTLLYGPGTLFTLRATPTVSFTGWSGGGCSSGDCQVTLNSNTTITANFEPIAVIQGDITPYQSLQSAYDAALSKNMTAPVILSRSMPIDGNLDLRGNVNVIIKGGYTDTGFTTETGFTTLNGALTISGGSLVVQKLILKK